MLSENRKCGNEFVMFFRPVALELGNGEIGTAFHEGDLTEDWFFNRHCRFEGFRGC